jgi:hypothetical protein
MHLLGWPQELKYRAELDALQQAFGPEFNSANF